MHRNSLLLCGIMAAGDNLNFGGIFFLSSFQVVIRAKPLSTFPFVSSNRHFSAAGIFADG